MGTKPNVVYMLVCLNKNFKNRVYIGYTVDPKRRLKQHNLGKEFGGAFKTNNKGPWEMVMFISGFPNEVSALRFEWTLQHPGRSRRLVDLRRKKRNETPAEYHIYLIELMINMGPWNRLPLSVHWLKEELGLHKLITVPEHVKSYFNGDIPKFNHNEILYDDECLFCVKSVDSDERITCMSDECSMTCHFICLANYMLGETKHIIPVDKDCPLCDRKIPWGDIDKQKTIKSLN